MIISHQKKFVMFAPWKTASSSLHVRLSSLNQSPYDRFYDFNSYLNRVVHQHMTCSDFCGLPESRLGYFTASFIRNPYDRVYSGFQQLQTAVHRQPMAAFRQPWVRELVMRQVADNFSQLCQAGFEFNEWVSLIKEHQIYEIGHNPSFPLHPSHYWTHIGANQFVQFIGRAEEFESDFTRFCDLAGLDKLDPVNANVVVEPVVEGEDRSNYKYISKMDRKSIDKINTLFRRDFELFGYQRY